MKFSDFTKILSGANPVAGITDTVQSDVQQGIDLATKYAEIQLILQVLSTAAIVTIAAIGVHGFCTKRRSD